MVLLGEMVGGVASITAVSHVHLHHSQTVLDIPNSSLRGGPHQQDILEDTPTNETHTKIIL